jgi:hypothetical protein
MKSEMTLDVNMLVYLGIFSIPGNALKEKESDHTFKR